MKNDGPARATIAVSSSSGLEQRLKGILDRVDVEVDNKELNGNLREVISAGGRRILVIDRATLPHDPTPYLEDVLCEQGDDVPILVVVTDGEEPIERVRLLAAGAAHVVDAQDSDDAVEQKLNAVAEDKREGPIGPEIRGNDARPQLGDFLSRSHAMRRFVSMVERVAPVDCTLLVTGETGVGKERLARAIHEASERKGPFVGFNCGALTEAILESQLFGHEPGAFTGASTRHKGFFEQADGGTLFIDEVAELPAHLQVKLLTALQRHEVQPLGAEKPIPVNVRVIAATNRDLKVAVREGAFRDDLYFRLNVVHLHIPPLRQRPEDIPDLVGTLIQFFRCEIPTTPVETISEAALDVLVRYDWPGNVRELVNVIERAIILGRSKEMTVYDLPADVRSEGGDAELCEEDELSSDWGSMSLKECRESAAERAERSYLQSALKEYRGKLQEVAKVAKIGVRSLYDKMQRYGLKKEDYRTSDDDE